MPGARPRGAQRCQGPGSERLRKARGQAQKSPEKPRARSRDAEAQTGPERLREARLRKGRPMFA